MAPRVLACGLATVDVVQTVERVPAPDEKVVALGTRVDAGGPALNAALTAALLGMPCRLATAVGGSSPTGSALAGTVRAACEELGVELVDLAPAGSSPPVATVLVTSGTGERAVVSGMVGGGGIVAAPDAGALEHLLDDVTAVLVDGHHLPAAVPLAAAARDHGIPVLLDAGSWKPGLEALLAHVDVLVASADFHPPSGDRLEDLLALGPVWVARSTGPRPVPWRAADGTCGSVEVPEVLVVDTLGAGDVLHGALLAHLGRHGIRDLPGALVAAVDVASRSVAAPGAHGWARPTR